MESYRDKLFHLLIIDEILYEELLIEELRLKLNFWEPTGIFQGSTFPPAHFQRLHSSHCSGKVPFDLPFLFRIKSNIFKRHNEHAQFHVFRDDLFVRLPKGGQSPKQKVVFQTQPFSSNPWKKNCSNYLKYHTDKSKYTMQRKAKTNAFWLSFMLQIFCVYLENFWSRELKFSRDKFRASANTSRWVLASAELKSSESWNLIND